MRPKHLLAFGLATALCTSALASEGGQAVNEQAVQYKSGAATVQATLFTPAAAGKHGAVVFLHDGSGMTAAFKSRCRDLSQMGFVVLAPQYTGSGSSDASPQLLQEIDAGREYLSTHSAVREGSIGILGTGQGGYLAIQNAIENPRAWRVVAQAGGAIDVPSSSKSIRSSIYLQHGDKDQHTKLADARWLNAELKRAGGSSQLKEYTMLNHGMWFWEEAGYDTDQVAQAKWAWEDMTNYLDQKLNAPARGTIAR